MGALGLIGGGCHAAPSPVPMAPDDDGRRAAEAMDAGDYGRAAMLYRRAVTRAPDSVPLRYRLGVATSYLEDKPETIRQFRWVVERGQPGTPEVDSARSWLVKAGVLPPSSARPEAPARAAGDDQPAMAAVASVEGRAVSPGDGGPVPLKRLQIYLTEHPSRTNQYRVRTDADGRFRFASVPPGIYQLSDRVAGQAMWRLRVVAKPGQIVFLDLGPGNSTSVRDDFPES
jgi:hypothetical protein